MSSATFSKDFLFLNLASLNLTACGVARGNRIVGGQDAAEREYPWMVSLGASRGYCGGALISASKVVTAAHCVSR